MGFWRKPALFCLGGSAYVGLEVLFRGRSHGSMFLAGGSCFLLLGSVNRLPLPMRGLAASGIITAVELITGLLVNRKFQVWDYRDLPGNFMGQICLPFSLLWIPVGLSGAGLCQLLEQKNPGDAAHPRDM